MTVTELAVATGILLAVLAIAVGALGGFQRAQAFGDRRNQTLESLRTGAAVFSRDARQARLASVDTGTLHSSVTCAVDTFCGDTLTFDTVVAGSPVQLVKWRFTTVGGVVKLVRTDPATNRTREFGGSLIAPSAATRPSFFAYREVTSASLAGTKPTITVRLNAVVPANDPPVGLTSRVALRNG